MKTAVITWDLPTPNKFGAAIESVGVFLSADLGSNFTFIEDVLAAAPQESINGDLATGDWIVKLVVKDVDGRTSPGVDTTFLVPDESPPGDVVNVVVTLS